jgi:hypothetical protein
MLKPVRIAAALLVMVTMLLSQLAVAAHPCPTMAERVKTVVATSEEHAMPCHDVVTADQAPTAKALCKQHCTSDHRTVVDSATDLPLQFTPSFVAPVAPLLDAAPAPTLPDFGLSHALGPPPALAHCCLRI